MVSTESSELMRSIVESYLLGAERRYTRDEVAAQAGVTPEQSRRLWSALGFPAGSDEEVEYTDADVDAVRRFRGLAVFRGADPRVVAAAARTLGQGMARLAEWQSDLVVTEILARAELAGSEEEIREAVEATISLFEELQRYTWRRHLSAAVNRTADGAAGADHMRMLAVGFADMVGYTRLTRHLHPDELSTLLEAFESTTASAVTDNGGWVIKHVGDEVMFAAETAVQGARIALAIHETTMMVGGTPDLRAALAYGPVLQRFGDLYGSVVNAAARLTGVARPGTVLLDDAAAAELAGEPEFVIRNLRSVRVRDFDRLRPHLLEPAT